MTALQNFSKKLEEEASDHERSILLVNIMNTMGFSNGEREIQIHRIHVLNVLFNIFRTTDKGTGTLTGSMAEGMCGGIYGDRGHYDVDSLCRFGDIKLYTPRADNINNTPPLLLHGNEDYDASYFVEEDDNFPGYVKLSLAEVNTSSALIHFTAMYDENYICQICDDGFINQTLP